MAYRRFLLIITVLVMGVVLSAPMAWAQIGQIKNITGKVTIVRGGNTIEAKIGDLLESSDTIRTASRSSVGITFIDNSRFSLGPSSQVDLDKFQFDATTHDGEFVTTVKKGTVLIVSGQIAKHSPKAMKVKTRSSILGVRGTKFMVKVR